MSTVYLLQIHHPRGEDTWICATYEAAQRKLHAYVTELWCDQVCGAMPTDLEAAIRMFFEEADDFAGYEVNVMDVLP